MKSFREDESRHLCLAGVGWGMGRDECERAGEMHGRDEKLGHGEREE